MAAGIYPNGIGSSGSGGGSGGGTAAATTLTPIVGVSGANVQAGMQSLANEFTDIKVADDTITKFQPVYLTFDNKIKRASADSAVSAHVFGIALQDGVLGANIVVQNAQEVTNPSWAWDTSKSIWLDIGLGSLTQIAPTGVGKQLCYLGMPTSATSFLLTPVGSRYLGFN